MTPPPRTAEARGTHQARDGAHVLRYERRLDHPVDHVWRALTDPDALEAWLVAGRVVALDAGRLVEVDSDLHGLLRWELEPDGAGTRVRFRAHVPAPDSYQALLEGWTIESCRAGWHLHLDHLEAVLDGDATDWPSWAEEHAARWRELAEVYAED